MNSLQIWMLETHLVALHTSGRECHGCHEYYRSCVTHTGTSEEVTSTSHRRAKNLPAFLKIVLLQAIALHLSTQCLTVQAASERESHLDVRGRHGSQRRRCVHVRLDGEHH